MDYHIFWWIAKFLCVFLKLNTYALERRITPVADTINVQCPSGGLILDPFLPKYWWLVNF